ncbi:MAG: MaoC/PaaZ C-terminal domain-containing protein [Saprospiraceae bacterium]
MLNYGIDECRFTKPVYPGMTIGVKLTVKEKVDQEKEVKKILQKVSFDGWWKYMTKPVKLVPWRLF